MRSQPQVAPFHTWFIWEGDPKKDTREIDWGDLPAIRISPADGPMGWLDEVSHELQLNIKLEIAVGSTDITQLFDAWAAVHSSLFTGNTLLGQLESYQVIQKTMTGTRNPAEGLRRQYGNARRRHPPNQDEDQLIMKRFLTITEEATFGTYASGGTATHIRLASADAFKSWKFPSSGRS